MKFFLVVLIGITLPSSYAFDFKKIGASLKKAAVKKAEKKNKKEKPKTAPKGKVCDGSHTMGICYEFIGKNHKIPKNEKGNKFACKIMKGKYIAKGNCPQANKLLGQCVIKKGTADYYNLFYYKKGRLTSSSAGKDCKNQKSSLHRHGPGKWFPRQ